MSKRNSGPDSLEELLGEDLIGLTEKWDAWSTGNPYIDFITGVGGLPKGKIVEAYGPFGSGKTSIFLSTAAQVQKAGKRVLWLDYEMAYNPMWARELGIDPDHVGDDGKKTFVVGQALSLEAGFAHMKAALTTPKLSENLGLIVVDSLAAMVPEALMEENANLDRIGLQAKRLSALLPQLVNAWLKQAPNVCICFVNQERQDLNFSPTPGVKYTTPGGQAPKYYASLRLQFRDDGYSSERVSDPYGGRSKVEDVAAKFVRVTTTKNRGGVPNQQTRIVFRPGRGIDPVLTTFHMAQNLGLVERSGAYFSISSDIPLPETFKAQGTENFISALEQNVDVYNLLEEAVIDRLNDMRDKRQQADLSAGSV